jgi:hypothetical protein
MKWVSYEASCIWEERQGLQREKEGTNRKGMLSGREHPFTLYSVASHRGEVRRASCPVSYPTDYGSSLYRG